MRFRKLMNLEPTEKAKVCFAVLLDGLDSVSKLSKLSGISAEALAAAKEAAEMPLEVRIAVLGTLLQRELSRNRG